MKNAQFGKYVVSYYQFGDIRITNGEGSITLRGRDAINFKYDLRDAPANGFMPYTVVSDTFIFMSDKIA